MALYRGEEFLYRTATIGGVTKTWAEWCEERGIDREIVKNRMRSGNSFEVTLNKPPKKGRDWWANGEVTINGETKSPDEWLKLSGITRMAAYQRQNRGMTLEEALSTPKDINTADIVSATIDGCTKTMREWCKTYGVAVKWAVQKYYKTRDAVYAVLPHREGMEYRREHGLIERREPVRTRTPKCDRTIEDTLSIHPTREVVEMCTNCPYSDCISTITKCLSVKRLREKGEIV